MIRFSTSALSAAARFFGIANLIPKGERAALKAAGELALKEKIAAIDDPTYQRPETRSSTGRPLWTRRFNWIGGQVLQMGRNSAMVTTEGPATAYERAMAFRNTSRIDGINRSNPARARAIPKIEDKLPETVEQAFNQAVGL